jgi:predicted amidohydrolase
LGVVIATTPGDEDCMTGSIDLDFIREVRGRYPLLDQRRPELYKTLGSGH